MYLKILLVMFVLSKSESVLPVIKVEGDIKIALLLENCINKDNEVIPFRKQSLISSAFWVVERINFLESLYPMKLGLEVYETCTDNDYFKIVFELYDNISSYTLGIVNEHKANPKLTKYSELLEIPTVTIKHLNSLLIKASIRFLNNLGWIKNVTIFAPNENIVAEFYKLSKSNFICIEDCVVYDSCYKGFNYTKHIVFFGNVEQIEDFIRSNDFENSEDELFALFVPLDGSVPKHLPYKSFVIIPPHNPATRTYKTPENILPSPIFIYTARAFLTYTKHIEHFVEKNCNETIYIVNCIREKFTKIYKPFIMTPASILETLKVETLKQHFVYDIYIADKDTTNISILATKNDFLEPLSKIFSYNIFYDNLTFINHSFQDRLNISKRSEDSNVKCNYYHREKHFNLFMDNVSNLSFRSEAWVYAFLSLSLLGVIVCMSILIFLLISICKKDVLEGNPVLTISLLVAVTFLFCSILPFSLEDNKVTANLLCLVKSLCTTLGYSLVFSLLLSRCILLATASKDIGFMSHIAGPVQAFLCLFIFGIQAALSLQIVGKCLEVFYSTSFIYLMSYNIMLLLLLLCLCPLIYKCERNYREGKYFCIVILQTSIVWSIWLPLFMFLDRSWNEPMLCLGLVCTAGGFLGAIFIPRTYLMTIAAARNKMTSALPSLNTANSIVDIYRTNTQPIYDCLNVAAINAVNVARAGVTVSSSQAMPRPDLYSCSAVPDDEDFDFRCDTPIHNDKVTRF